MDLSPVDGYVYECQSVTNNVCNFVLMPVDIPVLPALTIEQANAIALAMVANMVLAWCLNRLEKMI